MIKLDNVWKSYQKNRSMNHVLRDVSITFPTGRSVGILGLNGAGKSTLVRILGAAEMPDRGTVFRDVRVSWPLGYTGGFQANLTARENCRFVARIYGEKIQYIEDFTYEFAELGEYFDLPLRNYSAGMRSRFAFAVSLACDFECYLVDEALETGDARFKEKFRRAFEERRVGSSVILVSHNEQTIRRNCDMAAILHNGSLTMYDDIKKALQQYKFMQTRVA
ncbi:MAG: ABC transporter ATP-binding protein [Granulosicoccus sp.]|nr:ABC transporter ATP-binding protein [Granulosicoccus sp.]